LIGQSLSHYRIVSKLGQGGMGEVYLATDLTLNRNVALKILPANVAGKPEALERFIREARAASSLNHPGISSIHEMGEAGGVHFIAMEFVDGQTLHDILRTRKLEQAEIVDIACQVAEALAEAHATGVLHRDIKPANVMVTARGRAKVLDFGLAKMAENAVPAAEAPTRTAEVDALTEPGVVMGSVNYMSPEQALGRAVDARSDLFSFGVLLYEMCAGEAPFRGVSWTEVIDQILHAEPEAPSRYNAAISPALDVVVRKAIRKDRDERYQSAADMATDLRRLRQDPAGGGRTRRPQWLVPFAALAAIAIAAATSVALWRNSRTSTGSPPVLTPFTAFSGSENTPAFSPDGGSIAYSWNGPQELAANIYIQAIGAGEPQRLTTGAGADTYPAFSPDGRLIAFTRNRTELFVIPRTGGRERKVADVEDPSIEFSVDGKFIAIGGPTVPTAEANGKGIVLVSVESGEKRPVTTPPAGASDTQPRFSPDGAFVAFARSSQPSMAELYVQPVNGGAAERLTFAERSINGLAWTADGREIVFASNRNGPATLWRIRASGGDPVQIAQTGLGAMSPAIARQGNRLAYYYEHIDTNVVQLSLIDPAGEPRARPIASTRVDASPDYSPDGKRIVFASNRSGFDEIYVADRDGSNVAALTSFRGGVVGSPVWSPDGTRIAFDARVNGNVDVYVMDAVGGPPRRLTTDAATDVVPTWSRDGKWLYFTSRRGGRPEIWKMPADGGRQSQITHAGGFRALESPGGKVIYYAKQRGDTEIWQAPPEGGEEKLAIAYGDGSGARVTMFAYWALGNEGIYFVEQARTTGTVSPNARQFALRFFSFATRQIDTAVSLERPPFPLTGGLAISPDRRSALLTQLDRLDSDIMVLENFR
jgi:Tol biopolymer transport system component/predicted Ser/Thr protein kinase